MELYWMDLWSLYNMIKPFEYYVQENLVRKSIPNTSMAHTLLEKAKIRNKRIKDVQEDEASIVFEDIYESIREAAQSLMEMYGYKPYSHEALIAFLKQNKLLSEQDIHIIDTYRIIRNDSVYRAETVSVTKTVEALKFSKKIIPEIEKKYKELLK